MKKAKRRQVQLYGHLRAPWPPAWWEILKGKEPYQFVDFDDDDLRIEVARAIQEEIDAEILKELLIDAQK